MRSTLPLAAAVVALGVLVFTMQRMPERSVGPDEAYFHQQAEKLEAEVRENRAAGAVMARQIDNLRIRIERIRTTMEGLSPAGGVTPPDAATLSRLADRMTDEFTQRVYALANEACDPNTKLPKELDRIEEDVGKRLGLTASQRSIFKTTLKQQYENYHLAVQRYGANRTKVQEDFKNAWKNGSAPFEAALKPEQLETWRTQAKDWHAYLRTLFSWQ